MASRLPLALPSRSFFTSRRLEDSRMPMTRSTRAFVVVAMSVVLAGAATYLVYRTIQSRPAREVEVAHAFAVVAAHPLSLGTMVTPSDVKLVPWPAAKPVPGGLTTVNDAT